MADYFLKVQIQTLQKIGIKNTLVLIPMIGVVPFGEKIKTEKNAQRNGVLLKNNLIILNHQEKTLCLIIESKT